MSTITDKEKEGWYALFLAITKELSVGQALSAIKHGGIGQVERNALAVAAREKSLRRVASEFHCSKNTVAKSINRPIQLKFI